MIVICHAYRAANRGDGWLVELTRDLVTQATNSEPTTLALDPAEMTGDIRRVLAPPTTPRAALVCTLASIRPTAHLGARIAGIPAPAEVFAGVGIGGGYLRVNNLRHEAVFRAHHLPQLRLLSALGERAVYLPVSIGPFPNRLHKTIQRLLRGVGTIAVRDDRSAAFIGDHPNVHRVPDLAACWIGLDAPALGQLDPRTAAIAIRDLPGSDIGPRSAEALEARGLSVTWGLQSSAGHTNDDRAYYRRLGVLPKAEPFETVLGRSPLPSVVVAGRLHAALAAIRSGVPTIHLGYERKSWGVFRDLGLEDYLFNAWTSNPADIATAAARLVSDPVDYWQRLTGNFPVLAAGWTSLKGMVARAAQS